MISAGELARPTPIPSWEAPCKACGHWMATVPLGTAWTRSRCHDRRCPEYGKAQTVRFVNGVVK